LKWPALLGGEREMRGPFTSGTDARRVIAAARAPYPGDVQPSARIIREEEPYPGAWDAR
jgi:hypothetical protein